MRIVINAGHEDTETGGIDCGAVGPTGLQEEDVVQAVAKRMRELAPAGMKIEFKRQPPRGLNVLLAALRRNPPDRLVSLHCNAPSTTRHECHVYYWRQEADPERLARSKALAERLFVAAQGVIAEKARLLTFPIARKQPDGSVLQFTPAIMRDTATQEIVLVELGFITEKHVEAAMRTDWWQDKTARALLSVVR
jgi:N-acetylmuramoyl-L-alanine amidase